MGKCLIACTRLAREGLLTDETMEDACKKFLDRVMPEAFKKLLTSKATYGWQAEVQEGIYNMLELFIDLVLARLPTEPVPINLLNVLAMAFDRENDWNSKNKDQTSNGRWQQLERDVGADIREDFTKPKAHSVIASNYGWLCDLINQFGDGNGFNMIVECCKRDSVTARQLTALIQPLANAARILNKPLLQPILQPCVDLAFTHVEKMGDAELRTKEVTAISDLLSAMKLFCHYFSPDRVDDCDRLRLDMICRMLKTPQFNTKMNGLKEVSRLIDECEQPTFTATNNKHITNISTERVVDWMTENKVLAIALEGNIDQVQYTDRIKAIVEFLGPRLANENLSNIWHLQDSSSNSQIMENVYAIVASASSKLSLAQFEHLTSLIKSKWETSNDRVREKILVLIGQMGREAKPLKSIQAILLLLWEVSHLESLPRHLVERALSEQLAIITDMSMNRDTMRKLYIGNCIDDIKKATEAAHVLPFVLHLHKLCKSFSKGTSAIYQKADKATLTSLNDERGIVKLLCISLRQCHTWAVEAAIKAAASSGSPGSGSGSRRKLTMLSAASNLPGGNPLKPDTLVDGRYTHEEFVNGHLDLLKFLLKEGDLWLEWERSKQIWESLVDNPQSIEFDREVCFSWFHSCLSDMEVTYSVSRLFFSRLLIVFLFFQHEVQQLFFKTKLLVLSPNKVSEMSFDCFREYFQSINIHMKKLRKPDLSTHSLLVESLDLVGVDYFWAVITNCPKEVIANQAIDYLLDLSFLKVSPKLKKDAASLHTKFINSCYSRLEAALAVDVDNPEAEAVQEGCEIEASKCDFHEFFRCLTIFGFFQTSLENDPMDKGDDGEARTTTSISVTKMSSVPINAKGGRLQKIRRLIQLAERYVSSVEEAHSGNRVILPHAASFHGQPVRIKVIMEPKKDEFNIDVRFFKDFSLVSQLF